ncbi:MAG: hypothetical protein INQ03_15950 [Candidatus Heimdallarchaeota archaeon]|nr:hypothetical protein [Candidatus Heimdallarchaeota archaeon]
MVSELILTSIHITRILYIIFELYISVLLFQQIRKYKITSSYLMFTATVVSLVSAIYQYYIINTDLEGVLDEDFGYLDTLLGIASAYIVLVFIDYYESSSVNTGRMIIATALSSLGIFNVIVTANRIKIENAAIVALLAFIMIMFFFFILIASLRSIKRMKRYANDIQKKAMNNIRMYYILSFGGITTVYTIYGTMKSIITEITPFMEFFYLVIPQILFLLSNYYLYLGFVRIKNPAILQPQKIDRFIIIESSGIPVYNYAIESEASHVDDSLLSGALTAITAILKESTNIIGDLTSITLGDAILMMKSVDQYTGVVFTQAPTNFLQSILNSLMNELPGKINKKEGMSLSNEDHATVDDLVKESFGYKF